MIQKGNIKNIFPNKNGVIKSSVTWTPGTNTVTSCVGSCNERVARFTVSGTLTIGKA